MRYWTGWGMGSASKNVSVEDGASGLSSGVSGASAPAFSKGLYAPCLLRWLLLELNRR